MIKKTAEFKLGKESDENTRKTRIVKRRQNRWIVGFHGDKRLLKPKYLRHEQE